jgi:hypothetical protein
MSGILAEKTFENKHHDHKRALVSSKARPEH